MTLVRALTLALALQVVLAVVTWWPEDPDAHRARPLLALDREAIDFIRVEQRPSDDAVGDATTGLSLVRDDAVWRIESAHGYPADPAKVTSLIDKLVGLSVRSPVATTPSSHNAMRVGEREYGRRITVRAGEDEYTVVLGAAASNQVNARLLDSDDVYVATGASEWSFSDQASRYWPTNYVNAAADGLSGITIQNAQGTIRLTRGDEGWALDDMPAGRSLDEAAVEDLVSRLVRLPMGQVVAAEATPNHGLDGGAHVLWTIDADNESIVGGYAIGREDGNDRFVKAEGQAHVIKLASSTLDALLDAEREALLAAPAADEAPAVDRAPAANRAPAADAAPASDAVAP